MALRRGIVVASHPEDHSVDIVMADDGSRLVGVQVMTPNGSSRSGSVDLPDIKPTGDKWDVTRRTGQDMIAMVDDYNGYPVVTGFLYPQVNQMLSKDPKLRIDRHQSDVTTMIDGDGNIQIAHPSGTYIRIGESPDKVDMTGKNADGNAAFDRNTARRVNIRIGLAGGTLELTMTPDGAVSLKCNQTISIEAGQPVTVKTPQVTLDTPETHLTGNLTVDGDTALQVVTSRGKDISSTHKHGDTMPGPGTTGVPV